MPNNQIENKQAQIEQKRANVRQSRETIKNIEGQLQELTEVSGSQYQQLKASLLRQWDDEMDLLDGHILQLESAISGYASLQEVQNFEQSRATLSSVKNTHLSLFADLKKAKEDLTVIEKSEKQATILLNTNDYQRFVAETNQLIQEAQQRKQALQAENDPNNNAAIAAEQALIQELQQALQTRDQQYQAQLQVVNQIGQDKTAKENDITQISDSIIANSLALESALQEIAMLNDPRYLVNTFNDNTPFLLLPVRVETRYMTIKHARRVIEGDTLPGFSIPDEDELWVRIFPDDIAIHTHENRLTAEEENAGHSYWNSFWGLATEGGIDPQLAAWRVLVGGYGNERAAWIAKQTTPTNVDEDPLPAEPTFPTLELKLSSWSEAAKSFVMPDRFVVRLYTDEENYREIVGGSIPDPLPVGMSPVDDESSFEQENGEVSLPDELKWLTDFQEAKNIGMGISIPLETAEKTHIHRILVLGLKTSADKSEATTLFENLIENHHYTSGGFSLIPQGTPTNNTEGRKSGYERIQEDAKLSLNVEVKEALFENETEILDKKDGQWFADLLGIDQSKLEHIFHADGTDICEAIAMNRALWPATMGYYVKQMLQPHVSKEERDRIRAFFNEFVSGRGKIPAFRVDNQPYGVITSTVFSRWAYTDTTGEKEAFYDRLNRNILQPLNSAWDGLVDSFAKKVDIHTSPADTSQHFLDILALHASSVEFHQRFANGTHKMWNLYRFLQTAAADPGALPVLNGDFITDIKADINDLLMLALVEPAKVLELNFLDSERLLNGPVIDAFDPYPYSETRGIQSFPDTAWNYIHWLLDNTTTIARIRAEQFDNLAGIASDQNPPKALLYLLLRHAYLQQYLETSTGILIGAGKATKEADLEIELQGLAQTSGLSKEEIAIVRKDVTEELTIATKVQIKQQVEVEFQNTQNVARHQIRTREEELFGQAQSNLQQQINTEMNSRISAYKSKEEKWEYVTKSYGGASGGLPMEEYVDGLLASSDPSTYNLASVKESLEKLKDLPTARLERAFAEHLDVCNYRLDSWMIGLVNERLEKQQDSNKGIYLGAFGVLENLKPNTSFTGVHVKEVDGNQNELSTSPDVDNAFNYIGDRTATLERDPDSGKIRAEAEEDEANQGFIHTPSVNHAVTAAILRAGYLSHKASGSDDNAMAVNLTSRRIRRALFYLEGIQNGQKLPALLGYRLEREMHDIADDFPDGDTIILDEHILDLRLAYPLNAGGVADIDGTTSIEQQEARNVIDGLALLNDYESDEENYDTKLESFGIVDTSHHLKIIACIQKIQDDMDAIADLLLSESVYQLSKGNIERSGAVMKALGEGTYIQTPEIIDTPRQGTTVTHRFGIQFDPTKTDASIWTDNGSARSIAEPALNGWLNQQLPLPGKICFNIEYDTVEIVDGEETTVVNSQKVTLSDLNIEPIDFVYLLGNQGGSEDAAELSERIAHYVLTTNDLSDNIKVRIAYTSMVGLESDEFSLFQILSVVRELKLLIGNSRALTAEDFLLPNQAAAGISPDALYTGLATDAVEERLRKVVEADSEYDLNLSDLVSDLNSAMADAGNPGDPMPVDPETTLDLLRTAIMHGAMYGIANSFPASIADNSESSRDQLVSSAKRIHSVLTRRLNTAVNLLSELDALTETIDINKKLLEIAQAVFGRNFKVYPDFELLNGELVYISRSRTGMLDEIGDMAVEEWKQGLAKVRTNMGNYHKMRLFSGSLSGIPANRLKVTQLPLRDDEGDRWVGMTLPDDYETAGDTLSFVLELPEGIDTGALQTGMVLDEWVETLPNSKVHTGVAMHYNEPNAEAPNSLIMAVTPEETGQWRWDDLMDTLNETLAMAKKRSVEPDHIKTGVLGQTLPALLAAISSNDSTPSLDFARNVVDALSGQYGHIAPAEYATE